MTQYDFDKLLEKYLQGACTPEEELLLDEWANRQIATENAALSEDTKAVKKRLWKRISKTVSPTNSPLDAFSFITTGRDSIRWFSWTKLGVAASFVLFCSIGVWYNGVLNKDKKIDTTEKQAGVEMTNTTGKAQIITLNDGSTVNLQPNSTLTFSEKFGDHNRIVYLKGEGFFNVKRDTTKPFYVYAGNLVTEVLGTSFTVKSYEKEQISEVIVVSGKVMVYNTADTEGGKKITKQTILTPNKKVVFEKTTQQIKADLVEKPIALNPPKTPESFIFQEEPLFDVLKKLENVYGLEIVPASALKDCVFTGDLNGLELQEQLSFICKSITGQFEKQQTRILIMGQGCH
jgi:ferric-dicitrate binding protein FerR (iron transport regulator)